MKLTKDKICRHCLVQRLVALAFIPNPDNLSDVDHIDENKLNNCVDNLRWVTHSANVKRSFRRTKNWKNIEVFQYNNEGDLLQKFPSVTSAAKANGIGTGIISKCCTDYEYVKTVGGFVFSYSELSKEEIKKIINSKTA